MASLTNINGVTAPVINKYELKDLKFLGNRWLENDVHGYGGAWISRKLADSGLVLVPSKNVEAFLMRHMLDSRSKIPFIHAASDLWKLEPGQ